MFYFFINYFGQAPLIMFFRKTRTIVLCFLGITILFIIIAVTNAGFPYKEKTSPQRYSLIVRLSFYGVLIWLYILFLK